MHSPHHRLARLKCQLLSEDFVSTSKRTDSVTPIFNARSAPRVFQASIVQIAPVNSSISAMCPKFRTRIRKPALQFVEGFACALSGLGVSDDRLWDPAPPG